MAKKDTGYIEERDGEAIITLASSATIGGAKVATLTMREPTVGDMKRIQGMRGTDEEREISGMANLCEITQSEVESLTIRNFSRLQEAFQLFTT